MRRMLDVVVVLTAVTVAALWWRGFAKEASPPAAVASPATIPEPVPVAEASSPTYVAEVSSLTYDEATARTDLQEKWRLEEEEWNERVERERLETEARIRESLPTEQALEQQRRDQERRELFAKHRADRQRLIREGEERESRARSAKASYEALRQHRRDCARVTGNGSIQAYGCEGINDRVRKAETDMKNARNRR